MITVTEEKGCLHYLKKERFRHRQTAKPTPPSANRVCYFLAMLGQRKRTLSHLVLACSAIAGLSGCAAGAAAEVSLNPSTIESRLQNEIELTSPGLIVDITPTYECPSVMRGQPGDTWICKGRFSEVTFDVKITLLDNSGKVSIDPLL